MNVTRCVPAGLASINSNLPRILRGLKAAVPRGTKLVDMMLYDPILAGYFSADSSTKALATASVALDKLVNGEITAADRAARFTTADGAGAFKTYDEMRPPALRITGSQRR